MNNCEYCGVEYTDCGPGIGYECLNDTCTRPPIKISLAIHNCPFCKKSGFTLSTFKYHLLYECDDFIMTDEE